jgi:hypothetical protein
MPDVDRPADLAEVFARARREVSDPAQPRVAIVTPGRMVMLMPVPGKLPQAALGGVKALLKSDSPLAITAVSYTKLEALMADEEKTKCIPFLGHLLAMASLGHHVIVFEGHRSAFEAGVASADVVLVDSGMVPFLQGDWTPAAFRLMKPRGRLLVHDRTTYSLIEVRPRADKGEAGAPGGDDMAYVNGLLTTLAETRRTIVIAEGSPLPDPAELTDDERARAWIATLPYDRASLSAERIIERLLRSARPEGLFRRRLVLRASLANDTGPARAVAFKLTAGLRDDGKQTVTIEPL